MDGPRLRSVPRTDRSPAASSLGSRRCRARPVPRRLSAGSGSQPVVPDQVLVPEPLAIHAQHDRAHHVDGVLLTQVVTAGELLHLAVQLLWNGLVERPVVAALEHRPECLDYLGVRLSSVNTRFRSRLGSKPRHPSSVLIRCLREFSRRMKRASLGIQLPRMPAGATLQLLTAFVPTFNAPDESPMPIRHVARRNPLRAAEYCTPQGKRGAAPLSPILQHVAHDI